MAAPWAVWTVLLPLAGATLAFLAPRRALIAAAVTAIGVPLSAAAAVWQVWRGGALRYRIGGWGAPLGIEWRADGLAVVMLAMAAVVGALATLYAIAYCSGEEPPEHGSSGRGFWPLWLFLWGALNALFLSADVFNLYVTLELVALSAVGLVAQEGTAVALSAAMRYLLVSLAGSLSYLMGVALLYAAHATMDLAGLAQAAADAPADRAALALMTAGLLLKTALFPLHFWLPPAHANAPAPVSALLSGLVVKASFYLLLRLWLEVFTPGALASGFLGWLGAAALFWGSIQALLQSRLKLLIAYSTVAQLGYLFLLFPLAGAGPADASVWGGGVYLALSHACAKAAFFLAAGCILHAAGHDRIEELGVVLGRLPISAFAFGLAGASLMGLPPSGGFVGKWLLLNGALARGHGAWAVPILAGGLLTGAYVFRVVAKAFGGSPSEAPLRPVPRRMEWAALCLSLVALLMGLIAPQALELLRVGGLEALFWPRKGIA